MVQLDYDEEMGPLLGMHGSADAEYEVERTIKRAELTAFLCLLKRVIGPVRVHVDNKGLTDGLRRGESKCIKPRTGDANVWIKKWEELHGLAERGILVEVEHVKKATRYQRDWENGNKGPTRRRKIGSGKEGITSQPLSEGDRTKTLVSPKERT